MQACVLPVWLYCLSDFCCCCRSCCPLFVWFLFGAWSSHIIFPLSVFASTHVFVRSVFVSTLLVSLRPLSVFRRCLCQLCLCALFVSMWTRCVCAHSAFLPTLWLSAHSMSLCPRCVFAHPLVVFLLTRVSILFGSVVYVTLMSLFLLPTLWLVTHFVVAHSLTHFVFVHSISH